MLGPQDDLFTPRALSTFLGETFTVSTMADRMGTRLTGPRLAHAQGYNIVSDGIVTGHVQVPGDGQPIVLMRDRQTTGGYPKIATVISADLARFAQLPPGAPVRFRAVSRAEAVEALARRHDVVAALARQLVQAGGDLTSERLLALNLVSGVTAGS
jgi:allophanate hydrolase subunit 2